jgi:flagellar hook-length control protein FliK
VDVNKVIEQTGKEDNIQQEDILDNVIKNEEINLNISSIKGISDKELVSLFKEISNLSLPINDLVKILKSEKVFQKSGSEIEMVNQLNGNELLNTLEKLISEIDNKELKNVLEDINEIISHPGMDMQNTIIKLQEQIEKIDKIIARLNFDTQQPMLFKELENLINKVEDGINIIQNNKVEQGTILLVEKRDIESINETIYEKSNEGNEHIEFQIVNENKLSEKNLEKGVKYTEMSLDQFKKDVGDKLNEIEKLIAAKDKMLIQLNPKNLGNLEILIQKTKEGIEISVEFEKKVARSQLELILDEVKRDFKDKNVEVNFNFTQKEHQKEDSQKRKNENQEIERKLEYEDSSVEFKDMVKELLGGI